MKSLGVFFIVVFCLGVASASFGFDDFSIETFYGPEDMIVGWVNMSFDDEPVTSVFESSFGDSMSLLDLLRNNSIFNPDCDTKNCRTAYSAVDGETLKTFDLDSGEKALFGFKLLGNVDEIYSIDFEIESNAGVSCTSQIEVDLFEGKEKIHNDKFADSLCSFSKSYGCFNSSKTAGEYTITSTPFCQKINLSESPSFKVGAWVKKVSGERDLVIKIHSAIDGEKVAECNLPDASVSGGEVACDVEYSVKEAREFYVCLSSSGGTGTYKAKGYADSEGCGFNGVPITSEDAAYKIFAQGKKYDSVGTIVVSNSLENDATLGGYGVEYLTDVYDTTAGSVECSTGCVIPVEIEARDSQQIIVKNLELVYNDGVGQTEDDKFYALNSVPAKVDLGRRILDIDDGFSVPDEIGNHSFELNFTGESLFKKNITVLDVPVIEWLYPLVTVTNYPQKFEIELSDDRNVSSVYWYFGNGDTNTTTKKHVVYKYNVSGTYDVRINVTDEDGRMGSKTFEVTVGSPKEIIEDILNERKDNLENVRTQIEDFSAFEQNVVNEELGVEEINNGLQSLTTDYAAALVTDSEEDYNQIMDELFELNVPKSIDISNQGNSLAFYFDYDVIDLDVLKTIGGGDYSNVTQYKEAIVKWHIDNLDTKVSFKEFYVEYENVNENLVKVFEINISEAENVEDYYFIIEDLADIDVEGAVQQESGYTYVELDSDRVIKFSTTEDISFEDLPIFFAPKLTALNIVEIGGGEEETKVFNKWIVFTLLILLLIVVGVIVYVVLQEWYKRKYEAYLFRNRNDLYNMVMYVENSKRKGFTDKEIISKLRRAGWSNEQIRYVSKKYLGKKTGMYELPIPGILKRMKGGRRRFRRRRF